MVPAVLRADVPVVPDADEAQRWARRELADPIYHERESIADAVLRWIMERLAELNDAVSGVDGRAAALVLGGLALVAVVVVLLVVGPVRRSRARGDSAQVLVDDTRTAAQMRADADRAAADGRWRDAVLDRFRAVLRSLEERAVLDERPGRTAHEAAVDGAAALPAVGDALHTASRLFDDVAYGDVEPAAQDDAWLRELDATVQRTRPQRATAAEPVGAP